MSVNAPSCFKAYDLRGKVPEELDSELAYRIGRAFVDQFSARRVVIGRDIRDSSPRLAGALTAGLVDRGAEVFDLGLCGTEEVYFATFSQKMDGGIMITASHNPMGYNGMKFVREDARPISADSGLMDIGVTAAADTASLPTELPLATPLDCRAEYVRHLLGYIDPKALKPLKIVINAGNGTAGLVADALAQYLPFELIRINHEPDETFPNGIPNPLLPENRGATRDAVIEHGADMGVAWDGDFDRCFLFDGDGEFIEGYYIVGLLAQSILAKTPGQVIIHDPRLTWNTIDIVESNGGIAIPSKAGHAFIKESMRRENAAYGGEMSAHHYFREFAYCDNGNIPWLLVAQLVSVTGKSLADLVADRITAYPSSGEINRRVSDSDVVLQAALDKFGDGARIDRLDGLGVEFDDWRFNLRASNTEPVIRLNVEARGDIALMEKKTEEILAFLDAYSA